MRGCGCEMPRRHPDSQLEKRFPRDSQIYVAQRVKRPLWLDEIAKGGDVAGCISVMAPLQVTQAIEGKSGPLIRENRANFLTGSGSRASPITGY